MNVYQTKQNNPAKLNIEDLTLDDPKVFLSLLKFTNFASLLPKSF